MHLFTIIRFEDQLREEEESFQQQRRRLLKEVNLKILKYRKALIKCLSTFLSL